MKTFKHISWLVTILAISSCTLFGCMEHEENSVNNSSNQTDKPVISDITYDISAPDVEIETEPPTLADIPEYGEYENLRYHKIDNEIMITGCVDCNVTAINVPADIYGYPVTKIESQAFTSCRDAEEFTLPDTITSVGSRAFEYTKLYEEVVYNWDDPKDFIIDGVLIDLASQDGTDFVIPDGVRVIADNTLSDIDRMTSVTVPEGVMYIGESAFAWNSGLENITLSSTIVSIGDCAFQDCWNLEKINIPNGTKYIGSYAFAGCEKLIDISIPESVEIFGNNPFSSGMGGATCKWLENKREENPLVIINDIVIDGKNCVGDLIIPDTVVKINGDAFENSKITSVVIPDSVESIGEYAFAYTKELHTVTISSGCKKIENDAFGCCEGLQEITFLNPSCEIPMSSMTIYNKRDGEEYYDTFWYDGVIKGYANSSAQKYADKYGYTFQEITR